MLRVPLDLCRTKFIALHQQRNRSRGERHGGSEELRNPWNQLLRLLYVRNDWLVGLTRARRHSGKGHGRAHQLHEVAARDSIVLIFNGPSREFILQQFLKSGLIDQLLEAPPILFPTRGRQPLAHFLQGQLRLLRRSLDLHQLFGAILHVSLQRFSSVAPRISDGRFRSSESHSECGCDIA